MDEERMLETPPRKRRRAETPPSSCRRNPVNKRFCPEPRPSSSPRTVRFEDRSGDDEAIAESDVPESPIPNKTALEVLFPLSTPKQDISSPFEKLNIKSSMQKKNNLATPVKERTGGDPSRSVKKSAKKTPGSVRPNKPQPFRIKSSVTSMIDHPLTVTPVASFPRVFLPISWLSGSTPRVFSTASPDNLTRIIGLAAVMIAKVEGEKSMVIIERIDDCVYSMSSLRKDLKIKDVRSAAKMSRDKDVKLEVKPVNCTIPDNGSDWWKNIAVQHRQSDCNRQVPFKFLNNETPSIDVSMEMAVDPPSSELSRHGSEFSADSGYASLNASPINPINTIKSQYLEALYSTRTSLAYFAKSALSRARSEYTSGDESLIAVLSHLILEDDQFNTKYESVVPSFAQDHASCSSEIITGEERRYLSQKFSKSDQGDHQRTTQRAINDLKIQEYLQPFIDFVNGRTQLQIIILAESLALHSESKDPQGGLDDAIQQDYEFLLASHLDRLSISGMLESDNDFSEQFMREILLPFYGSRFPRVLDMIGCPIDFTSPIKLPQPKKSSQSKSLPRKSIVSPDTLRRISRPQRPSPTPFPIITARKTFKSSSPKKVKVSKSAGLLKRLQKTEVSMSRNAVASKKAGKAVPATTTITTTTTGGLTRVGSTFGGVVSQRGLGDVDLSCFDRAEVQVPATPAPKKKIEF